MITSHTPGPWRWRGANLEQVETGVPVMTAQPSLAGAIRVSDENAAVIAAAPDLLAAARSALIILRGSGYTENAKTVVELKAAIAKAEEGGKS